MDDLDLERLLKSAGPRERPPPEVEQAVRAALRAEWAAMQRSGRERRYRQEDLGPAVKGFGDAVPAFMLIPLPRPRAEKAASPEAEAEAA